MPKKTAKRNEVRIIGGQWRGRKLAFPDIAGLRPTPDRVRETLFNWLSPVIIGARCLDCFAGSGVIGLEALSRGAKDVTLIDQSERVLTGIEQSLAQLQANNAHTVLGPLPEALLKLEGPFDIVFLDPPFYRNLIEPCLEILATHRLLAPRAHIYVETESQLTEVPTPEDWTLLKDKQAGEVRYRLFQQSS